MTFILKRKEKNYRHIKIYNKINEPDLEHAGGKTACMFKAGYFLALGGVNL
ncbi:MAG: hypothetical protein HY934_07125 [Candidatus Firestonebacteria bacterium]|nr:hypothetical protein [Candidatus Firestonebacteria bacterium]